jgi:hypothetical protein
MDNKTTSIFFLCGLIWRLKQNTKLFTLYINIQVGMEPPNPTLYSVQRIQVGMEPPNSIPPYILYKGSLCWNFRRISVLEQLMGWWNFHLTKKIWLQNIGWDWIGDSIPTCILCTEYRMGLGGSIPTCINIMILCTEYSVGLNWGVPYLPVSFVQNIGWDWGGPFLKTNAPNTETENTILAPWGSLVWIQVGMEPPNSIPNPVLGFGKVG